MHFSVGAIWQRLVGSNFTNFLHQAEWSETSARH